jgi:hypothetical protein
MLIYLRFLHEQLTAVYSETNSEQCRQSIYNGIVQTQEDSNISLLTLYTNLMRNGEMSVRQQIYRRECLGERVQACSTISNHVYACFQKHLTVPPPHTYQHLIDKFLIPSAHNACLFQHMVKLCLGILLYITLETNPIQFPPLPDSDDEE